MVGMNYKLKERKVRAGNGREGGNEEGKRLIKSSSVCFTERRGTFSTLVSASTKFVKVKSGYLKTPFVTCFLKLSKPYLMERLI